MADVRGPRFPPSKASGRRLAFEMVRRPSDLSVHCSGTTGRRQAACSANHCAFQCHELCPPWSPCCMASPRATHTSLALFLYSHSYSHLTTPPPFTPLAKMMRLSRSLARPSPAAAALRNARNYVVASQTQRAQEATVSVPAGKRCRMGQPSSTGRANAKHRRQFMHAPASSIAVCIALCHISFCVFVHAHKY